MRMPSKNSTFIDEGVMEDDEMEGEAYESETESEEEEEEEEDVKLMEPKKDSVCDRDGLGDKLQDIRWPEDVEWIHKLSIDINQEQEVDVNDDSQREFAFYRQALEGTRQAFEKLQSIKFPFLRPPDYYAEMVKSDAHMEKIRGWVLANKRSMEEAEERKKAREAKKLAKEVQAQKLKERAKQKKEEIENVKKWRKQRQQSGFARGNKGGEMDFAFEDGKAFERSNKKRPRAAPGDRSGGKARQGGKGKKVLEKKQKNREFKNSKFGHGGRKGLKKQNTAETTDNFKAFNKGGGPGNKKRKR